MVNIIVILVGVTIGCQLVISYNFHGFHNSIRKPKACRLVPWHNGDKLPVGTLSQNLHAASFRLMSTPTVDDIVLAEIGEVGGAVDAPMAVVKVSPLMVNNEE